MKLFISFSGGRTSAYMTRKLLERREEYDEIVVIFANTGSEDWRTLLFVDQCDKEFGFNVVWVEAVVHPGRGVGTTHKIVTYQTAARDHEPFEAVIRKFGIPNSHYPHCTRELKQRPMYSFLRKLGWKKGEYKVAIGIRSDEIDRVSESAMRDGAFYPLVDWGIAKPEILADWSKQPFNLLIPEHYGNCRHCHKKSDRKLLTIAKEAPDVFDFPTRMEQEFGFAGPGNNDGPRRHYRGNRSALQILELAQQSFTPFVDTYLDFDPELDVGGACGESCEVFADDYLQELL